MIKKYTNADFSENGYSNAGTILNKKKCQNLRDFINSYRPVKKSIFYQSEKDFKRSGRYKNYAPGPGHNFLEQCDTSFIEQDERFIKFCSDLMGEGYEIFKKSIIRSTPERQLPRWLKKKIVDVGRPNLNPYIKNEFQDVQFFLCTDFHQDKTRQESEFVTVYIYLDKVSSNSSALNIILGSHKLGFTSYPHILRKSSINREWHYNDMHGNYLPCKELIVTGNAGSVVAFHNLTLHGTNTNNDLDPRISLRYLIKNKNKVDSIFTSSNQKIFGKLFNDKPRLDVSETGEIIPMGSNLILNKK